MHCHSHGVTPSHEWKHDHIPANEDTGKELRDKFDRLMAEEKRRLVRVLTEGNRDGMSLASFHGKVGDEGAVREWLDAGW